MISLSMVFLLLILLDFDKDDHVVISDASDMKVRFYDGSEKNCCNILRRDNKHDFAILEIENDNYQAVNLGSYKTIKVGNEVFSAAIHLTAFNISPAME
jgi:hypothetical protein